MKKPKRPKAQKRSKVHVSRGRKGRRLNSFFAGPLPSIDEHFAGIAANLSVSAALVGASASEKMILSALMPGLLGILRSVTKPADIEKAAAKILKDDEPETPRP